MYCLRWWIPLFLLPFPLAPPSFLILFIIAYVFHTRPCAYCAVIIVGLFISSCYWYLDLVPADAVLGGQGQQQEQQQQGVLNASAGGAADLGLLSGSGADEILASSGAAAAATLAQQVAMLATSLLTSGVKVRFESWRQKPVRLRSEGSGSGSGIAEPGSVGEQDSKTPEGGTPSTVSEQDASSIVWANIIHPLRRRDPTSSQSQSVEQSASSSAQEGNGGSVSGGVESSTSFAYTPDQQNLLARCPGSGRCWLDLSLMATHGLFSASPSYRLPRGGCRSMDGASSSVSGEGAQSPSSSAFPTLQELLEDAKRQIEEERAYQEDLQRKIDEEQAEVTEVVVAAEKEEAAVAAAEAAAAATDPAPSSSSSDKTRPVSRSKEDLKREERQSWARRLRSRSRKPAFRKADPEVDGEHARGTYWIGVPGTAVGAFFDFTLR
ncbi:hypothetical protein A4X09_0g3447 [Tilletia walkeri]|uniref:Uncharacterized protein n=1 Tax=Tilletia walkeri TaxID=117179 RepID=A0A8X7T4T4_9BASI|nr:hypothetical protein A4X09_0g3447 [Tilletia walkeri]